MIINSGLQTTLRTDLMDQSPALGRLSPQTESDGNDSLKDQGDDVVRVPTSCMRTLDALWFCYSPVYQARKYYMNGEFDNCRGRLKLFRMCIMSRFQEREKSERLYEEEEKKTKVVRAAVWEFREEYIKRQQEEESKRQQAAKDHVDYKESDGWWL